MLYLLLFLLATCGLWYGAYWLGTRSDLWSLVLAPLLLFAAWRVLLDSNLTPGEGAAVGVAVVIGAVWYVGGMCVLLALMLVGASWRARRSAIVAAFSLCVVAPAVLMLGYRVQQARTADSASHREPPPPPVAPRDAYTEGYAWAIDNGIDTDSACGQGSPAFVDGCRKAVHRNGR